MNLGELIRSVERNCIWLMKLNRHRNEIERLTSFRLRSQKLERIHDLMSDWQMVRISEYPSLKIRILHHEDYDHYHFGDDIETLQNPRNSDESKISNTSTCIDAQSIFIVTFPCTSGLGSDPIWKIHKINAYLITRDESRRSPNVTMQRFGSSVHVVWYMNEVKSSMDIRLRT